MDIGDICDFCEESDCERCYLGNPCLGCEDYKDGGCLSKGGCGQSEKGSENVKGMELLQVKIKESGYKLNYVAERCGLTYQGLKKKLDGETEFKVSEMGILKDLLKLTEDEVQAIFFENDVD